MKDFSELKESALEDPVAKRSYGRKKKELLETLRLADLRQAREVTQSKLAKNMKTTQSSISRMEKQTDLYITTLRSYIEGIGGKLEITAVFPDGEIPIKGFGSLDERGRQGMPIEEGRR